MSSVRFKQLLNNLAIATSKLEEKKLTRQRVQKQIGKIRKVSLDTWPPKKQVVDREITKLEKHIEDLIEKEKFLVSVQKKDDEKIDALQNKIKLLDTRLETMNNLLMSLGSQPQQVQETEPEPEYKTAVSKEQIENLKKSLTFLERRHEFLKQSGQHSPEDLARVQEKIDSIKDKLAYLF